MAIVFVRSAIVYERPIERASSSACSRWRARLVVALGRQLFGEVRVADRAAGAMPDSFELLDRPDCRKRWHRRSRRFQLDHAEVDQTTTELFDAPDAFGELDSAAKRLGGIVEPILLVIDAADHAHRLREPDSVVVLFQDPLSAETVLERFSESTRERLRDGKLEEKPTDEGVLPRADRLKSCEQHVYCLVVMSRHGKRPAVLDPERNEVGIDECRCAKSLVHDVERLLVCTLLAERGGEAAPGADIARGIAHLTVELESFVVTADVLVEVGKH